jgi:hypothetical protein
MTWDGSLSVEERFVNKEWKPCMLIHLVVDVLVVEASYTRIGGGVMYFEEYLKGYL